MGALCSFDLISDVHLDFWVDYDTNHADHDRRITEFVHAIVPEHPSSVLVIAGDLGHYNYQNFILLDKLKKVYSHIVIVKGNHDYYLVSKSIRKQYGHSSEKRLAEMMSLAGQLGNVHYLNGTTVRIDGITFGGCGMWYDFQYGIQELRASPEKVLSHWKDRFNDSVLIKGITGITEAMFREEKLKLLQVIEESNVVVTHVSPDWSHVPESRRTRLSTSFYYFDGGFLTSLIKGKIWCFGHVHHRSDYMRHDCRFVNASLGYPDENRYLPQRAATVPL